MPQIGRAIGAYLEYYKSKIFVSLRDGALDAYGAKIIGSSWESLNEADTDKDRLSRDHMKIDNTEWGLSRIDWNKSILYGAEYSYCLVHVDVKQMLSVYPIPDLPPFSSVSKLVDVFVLDRPVIDGAARGRPPLPWDPFHVEVAALVASGGLPEKKEAAIAHFENWFREKLGQTVGRSSISQKLTPYYKKFSGRRGRASCCFRGRHATRRSFDEPRPNDRPSGGAGSFRTLQEQTRRR